MSSHATGRLRRLPVFFILDTSDSLSGAFQVTLQQGPVVTQRQLDGHDAASRSVYIGTILCGPTVTYSAPVPLSAVSAPSFTPTGSCLLRPALKSLVDGLTYDLIAARPEHPGDYPPVVFAVLGEEPADDWQDMLSALQSLGGNRRPLIVALTLRQLHGTKLHALTPHALTLRTARADYLTDFFRWAGQAIANTSEANAQGNTRIDFPPLPYGVVSLRA